MDKKKLKAMVKELAKDVKSEKDLSALSGEIVKLTVETALNAEIIWATPKIARMAGTLATAAMVLHPKR